MATDPSSPTEHGRRRAPRWRNHRRPRPGTPVHSIPTRVALQKLRSTANLKVDLLSVMLQPGALPTMRCGFMAAGDLWRAIPEAPTVHPTRRNADYFLSVSAKAQSLPRGFGRSRSLESTAAHHASSPPPRPLRFRSKSKQSNAVTAPSGGVKRCSWLQFMGRSDTTDPQLVNGATQQPAPFSPVTKSAASAVVDGGEENADTNGPRFSDCVAKEVESGCA
jgi:hypothetical protein